VTAVHAPDQQAASLTAAAAQLELALRESAGPVDALGQAFERMSVSLAQLRSSLAATAEGKLHATCREVLRDVSVCVENLQFYDRLVQHLSHLRDYLSGLSGSPDAQANGGRDPAAWQELRAALRQRLISEAQRELLDLILPPPHAHGTESPSGRPLNRAPLHVGEGSIELF
jgi:hypothetical protein